MAPTRRALWLLAGLAPLALLPALGWLSGWALWLVALGAWTLAVGLDAVLSPTARGLSAQATAPALLYIGAAEPMTLAIQAAPRYARTVVAVRWDVTAPLVEPPTRTVTLDDEGAAGMTLELSAERRGSGRLVAAWLRWTGPLRLWSRVVRRPLDAEVPVAPHVRAVREAAVRFFAHREFVAGLKSERYVGDGSEFDALREFRRGDDPRAIDWKASARHVSLLVREFRAERNHRIILAIDTGHLMSEPLEGIPRLDHAINAALLLGFVALRTGDQVGLFAFDDRVRLYGEPHGGMHTIHRLERWVADLEYGTGETNFTLGLTDLATRLRRRSLVVVFTDFVDTVTAELMLDNLRRLARRHLVVFVSLRDPVPEALVEAAPRQPEDVARAVVAQTFVQEREVVTRRLARLGVQCVDAAPRAVTVSLLNRYLDIKRRELV